MRRSDLDLMFQKGQEFTRRDDHHAHCVILELLPRAMSYRVSDTASGNVLCLSEAVLRRDYLPSCAGDREDALRTMGTGRCRKGSAT